MRHSGCRKSQDRVADVADVAAGTGGIDGIGPGELRLARLNAGIEVDRA